MPFSKVRKVSFSPRSMFGKIKGCNGFHGTKESMSIFKTHPTLTLVFGNFGHIFFDEYRHVLEKKVTLTELLVDLKFCKFYLVVLTNDYWK